MQRHRDNIGLLRLLFASFVIVGHAPEMVDGDRGREPLTAIFHTISLGELAVDAFFLISGYLITMSWIRTNSLQHFLVRRVLRIYPAFVLAYILSVFLLGPIVGAAPWRFPWETAMRLFALQPPKDYPGQLTGLHYPLLNGTLWTIAYEFRCYLLVAVLGLLGLLRQRWLMLSVTAACLIAFFANTFQIIPPTVHAIGPSKPLSASIGGPWFSVITAMVGQPWFTLRFTTVFLVGMCFYLFKDEIFQKLDARTALLAGAGACILMFNDPHIAEVALITLGGASIFWFGFKANLGPFQQINDRWDISYGVYLYGWPIATAIRWFDRDISPLALAVTALPLALLMGAVSWWSLERWTKDWARSWSDRGSLNRSAAQSAGPMEPVSSDVRVPSSLPPSPG